MSDTKFTPGPWESHPRMSEAPHSYPVSAGAWTFYARSEADARLIAAAPSMYEALKLALESWDLAPPGRI